MVSAEQGFGFYIPTVAVRGIGSRKELDRQVKTPGAKRPLLYTDKGITQDHSCDGIISLGP
jgi:hypothetical protein